MEKDTKRYPRIRDSRRHRQRQGDLPSEPYPAEFHVRVHRRTRKVEPDVGQGWTMFRPCLGVTFLDTARNEFFLDRIAREGASEYRWGVERGRCPGR